MAAPSAFGLETPKKSTGKKADTPWIAHVRATQAANPGMSWKDAMKAGKLTYQTGGGCGAYHGGKKEMYHQTGGLVRTARQRAAVKAAVAASASKKPKTRYYGQMGGLVRTARQRAAVKAAVAASASKKPKSRYYY